MLRSIKLLCFLVAFGGLTVMFGARVPHCNAIKTEIAPVIDGNLTDSVWEKSEWQSGFKTLGNGKAPLQKTEFKVLYDDKYIYFAVKCFENNINRLKITAKENDGPVYVDDSVELFVVPDAKVPDDPNWRMFYHFIVNARGVKYEETSLGGVNNKGWDCPWKAATKIYKDCWVVEIAIPFFVFDIKKSNVPTWRLNIARNRKAGACELSSWSLLKHSFSEAERFGFLNGLKTEFKNHLISFSLPETTAILNGDKIVNGIKLNLVNNSDFPRKCELEVQLWNSSNDQSYISRINIKLPQNDSTVKTIEFPDIPQGKYSCIIAVNLDGKTVKFKEVPPVNIDLLPLKIVLKEPHYRNIILPAQNIKKIVLGVSLFVKPDKLKEHNIIVKIKDIEDRVVASQKVIPGKTKFSVEFDACSLAYGDYKIEAVMFAKKREITRLSLPFRKLKPTTGNQVWIDKDLNLVVNGRKTFPHGFLAAVSDASMSHIKGKGFNIAHTYVAQYKNDEQLQTEILEPAAKARQMLMFYPYYKTMFGFFGFGKSQNPVPDLNDIQRAGMLKRVRSLIANPNILAWYLCDEPRGAEFRRNLKKIYKLLAKTDPYHPVVALDCSPTEAIALAGSSDIIICDFYPDFDKKTGASPLGMIYNGIKEVIKCTGNKYPIWFCAKAFDRSDYYDNPEQKPFRAPSYIESRCMNYLALTAGAKGLLYFQLNGKPGIMAHPEMKMGIIEGLGAEISAIAPVLLENPVANGIKVSNSSIMTTLKVHKGKYFLLAVNPKPHAINNVAFEIMPASRNKIAVLFENRTLNIKSKKFYDSFKPYEVHVYTDDLDYPCKFNIAKMIEKINSLNKNR
jgi:hypothetical protein